MSYTHLTEQERYAISHHRLAGRSVTQIAGHLNRSKGTISRELRRNAGPGLSPSEGGERPYWDRHAHASAKARRMAGRRPYKLGPGPLLEQKKREEKVAKKRCQPDTFFISRTTSFP